MMKFTELISVLFHGGLWWISCGRVFYAYPPLWMGSHLRWATVSWRSSVPLSREVSNRMINALISSSLCNASIVLIAPSRMVDTWANEAESAAIFRLCLAQTLWARHRGLMSEKQEWSWDWMLALNVRIECLTWMLALNVLIECWHWRFALNVGIECLNWMFELNVRIECLNWMFELNVRIECLDVSGECCHSWLIVWHD